MGTLRWRYTSTVPSPLFVDAMQEVVDRRGWRALADEEVAMRYLEQLWDTNVEQPWDEWDVQWELYDEGADVMIRYRAKLQRKLRPKEAKAQEEKEKRPKYAQDRRVTPGRRMLTAQPKADLDKQIARTEKDMAKARVRLRELLPKVGKANSLSRATKRWAPNDKKIRKIRKLPPALKPLEREKAITGITHERNRLHAFAVALRGEVGGTTNDVFPLDVAGSPASLSYSTLIPHKGMPCNPVTGAQALVAQCFYVAIQAAFVLFSMDRRVWFERPPPFRSLTMTVRNFAELLQKTRNWFNTLVVFRASTWHREAANALHVLAAHNSLYVPVTNEVFPAVLAYKLREFDRNPTQVWARWSGKRWGYALWYLNRYRPHPEGLHPWYKFSPQLVDDLWGQKLFCVDRRHLDFCARQSVRPGLTSTSQFDDADRVAAVFLFSLGVFAGVGQQCDYSV